MNTVLLIVQIVLAVLLSAIILMQEKGEGLGDAISGVGNSKVQMQKRGPEKLLSQATIILVILFLGISLATNFLV